MFPNLFRKTAVTVVFLTGGMAVAAVGDRNASERPVAERLRPPNCFAVEAGAPLQSILDAAGPGSSFCLAPGEYTGPIALRDRMTLWGPPEAVIRTTGIGGTVNLEGAGPTLLGLTVVGSGRRFDKQDSAVHVQGDGARIEGIRIHDALFGIVVDQSSRVVIRGNQIRGTDQEQLGLRGDTIRLWETRESVIEDNVVRHGRDIVVWYSPQNTIRRNTVKDSRYGTHFMYSHDNLCTDNRYEGNVVGVFAMYSRGLTLTRNVFATSSGAAGMGLGMKESSGLTVLDNQFVKDNIGIFIDNSPYEPGSVDRFENNAIRLCGVGVLFHASVAGNRFRCNSFRDNGEQVRVDGGGDAEGTDWSGNDFDDYHGYDMDGDGFGDVPYELRRLSSRLRSKYPNLDFFTGSPALFLVDAVGEIMPLYAPKTILTDPKPRLGRSPVRHAD